MTPKLTFHEFNTVLLNAVEEYSGRKPATDSTLDLLGCDSIDYYCILDDIELAVDIQLPIDYPIHFRSLPLCNLSHALYGIYAERYENANEQSTPNQQ